MSFRVKAMKGSQAVSIKTWTLICTLVQKDSITKLELTGSEKAQTIAVSQVSPITTIHFVDLF